MTRQLLNGLRIFIGALAIVGVVVQLLITIDKGHSVVNFFSYFTILTNSFAGVILIVSAVKGLRGHQAGPLLTTLRGAATVYIVFVGIVFSALLRDAELGDLLPWINTVHHYLIPVLMLLDWLAVPPTHKIKSTAVLFWLTVPALYVFYSVIRGAVTRFYPYPFFSPVIQQGYGGVAVYCLMMLVVFLAVGLMVRATGNRRPNPPAST